MSKGSSGVAVNSKPMSEAERARVKATISEAERLTKEGDSALEQGKVFLAEEKYRAALANLPGEDSQKAPIFSLRLARLYL